MSEFTGERVIPGKVNEDLWAEHISRYVFAGRFTPGKRVLDLGCGTGYGTAELAKQACIAVGIDLAMEAVSDASANFPSARFLEGSATALPFAANSFDVVTAFEVIEHLSDWSSMLAEARRVLRPDGVLIVSTPNKLYYAEARGKSGPNPYHQHEFEFAEFRSALEEVFGHVALLLQDRLEAFAFYAPAAARPTDGYLARYSDDPTQANFFVGVCSSSPLPNAPNFVYVPRASNLLSEREKHIRLLESELTQVKLWIQETMAERDELLGKHQELETYLSESNQQASAALARLTEENLRKTAWAEQLAVNLKTAQEQTVQLQEENLRKTVWAEQLAVNLKSTQEQAVQLQEENLRKTAWAEQLATNLKNAQERIVQVQKEFQAEQERAVAEIASLTEENDRKTIWARDNVRQLKETEALLETRTQQFNAELAYAIRQVEEASRQLTVLEATVNERTAWAQQLNADLAEAVRKLDHSEAAVAERTEKAAGLDAQLRQVQAQIELMRQSRWIKVGRRIGLGPELQQRPEDR